MSLSLTFSQEKGLQNVLVHQENKHILTILGKSAVVLTRLGDKRLAIMIPIGLAENSINYLITRVRQGQILKSVSKAEASSTITFSCFGKNVLPKARKLK